MKKLNDIMATLSKIEYNMDCFLKMLDALEEIYELRHEHEAHANVVVFIRHLSAIHADLAEEISNIDELLLDTKDCVTD